MSKIVIGIHGLANKPKKEILYEGWLSAIKEGLQVNENSTQEIDFQLVYWADSLYKDPLHDDKAFDFDALYNDEPYVPALEPLKEYKDGFWDDMRGFGENVLGGGVDFVHKHLKMDSFANWVLGKALKDLAFYYSDRKIPVERGATQLDHARKVLQSKLIAALNANKEKEILLVAHSMGSIIGYDVLRDLGQDLEFKAAVKRIDFVTIGSPLGLAHVKSQIQDERGYDDKAKRVRTPSIVNSWVNYADRKDIVAADSHLKDDYKENASGVKVKDDLVYNQYAIAKPPNGEIDANHHKSYGYLRTPEFSKRLKEFLE